MSWSLSELKDKNTGLTVFNLENDTMSSHYLFDEDEEFIEYFDYGCDLEIHENYELVHSVNSDFKFTQEQWNDLFRRLIEKAEFKQACIEALKKPIIKEKVIIKK